MTMEELAVKLQKTDDRSLRNEGRIKKLEDENGTLHSLATSVAVMAEQMKQMNKSVTNLASEVEEIKEKPGKRWESIVTAFIVGLASALLGFILGQLGL